MKTYIQFSRPVAIEQAIETSPGTYTHAVIIGWREEWGPLQEMTLDVLTRLREEFDRGIARIVEIEDSRRA